jgi:hypothetical protein
LVSPKELDRCSQNLARRCLKICACRLRKVSSIQFLTGGSCEIRFRRFRMAPPACAQCAGAPAYRREVRQLRKDGETAPGLPAAVGRERYLTPTSVWRHAAWDRAAAVAIGMWRAQNGAHFDDDAGESQRGGVPASCNRVRHAPFEGGIYSIKFIRSAKGACKCFVPSKLMI